MTPAMIAVKKDHVLTFGVLLKYQAFDYRTKDKDGKTINEYLKESIQCKDYYNENTKLKKTVIVEQVGSPRPMGVRVNSKVAILPDNSTDSIFSRINPKCKVHEVYKKCMDSNQPFVDSSFPAHVDSITKDKSHPSYELYSKAVWRRPHEFMKAEHSEIKVFDNIDPNDIIQGQLGVSYFLACLSCIGEFPSRILGTFNIKDSNKYGVYSVKFYVSGVPTEIVVDDLFPCDAENPDKPLFSNPKGKELWVLILEKAWAKLFKQYTIAEHGDSEWAFQYLNPAPATTYYNKEFEEVDDMFEILEQADKKKWMISCFSGSKEEKLNEKGLLQKHTYALLDVYEYNGVRLLKLRNPWGKMEFKGNYSEKSEKWTTELKRKVGFAQAEDGMFFMTDDEFKNYFKGFSINYYHDEFLYTYETCDSGYNHAVYYQFEIKTTTFAYFRIHQQDEKSQKDSNQNLKCSPGELTVCLVMGDGTLNDIVRSGKEKDSRRFSGVPTISLLNHSQGVTLYSGKYIIRAKFNWLSKKSEPMTLSVYSSKEIILQKPDQPVKDFYLKRFNTLGNKHPEKKVIKEGVFYSADWYEDRIFYFWLKNEGTKVYEIEWTLKSKDNVRLKKNSNVVSETQVKLKLEPGKSDVIIVKKIDLSKKNEVSYDWTNKWN